MNGMEQDLGGNWKYRKRPEPSDHYQNAQQYYDSKMAKVTENNKPENIEKILVKRNKVNNIDKHFEYPLTEDDMFVTDEIIIPYGKSELSKPVPELIKKKRKRKKVKLYTTKNKK
jgi:hypothetical protein